MARIIDITEKLSFEESPLLMIKGRQLAVNDDAPTVLKIMNFMGGEGVGTDQVNAAYELIFPEKSRKEIEKMKLNMADWTTVVQAAISLIVGEGAQGE